MQYIFWNHRIFELERTHMDHQVQFPVPLKTIQSSNPMSASTTEILLELWQLGTMPTALDSPLHAHHALVKKYFITTWPFPDAAPCCFLRFCCWSPERGDQFLTLHLPLFSPPCLRPSEISCQAVHRADSNTAKVPSNPQFWMPRKLKPTWCEEWR